MEEKLEIAGKEYIFTVNRKTVLSMTAMQKEIENSQESGIVNPELIDKMAYAYLKPYHKEITMEEVSSLLDDAEKEYGTEQIIQFVMALAEEVFHSAQKDKYKVITFLVKMGDKKKKK